MSETTETNAEGRRAGLYFAAATAWFGAAKTIDEAGPEVAAVVGMTAVDAALNGAAAFASGVASIALPPSFYDITSASMIGGDRLREAVAAAASEVNARYRFEWAARICTGIDAARRATPVTATEIRERNGWRVSWRVVPR